MLVVVKGPAGASWRHIGRCIGRAFSVASSSLEILCISNHFGEDHTGVTCIHTYIYTYIYTHTYAYMYVFCINTVLNCTKSIFQV